MALAAEFALIPCSKRSANDVSLSICGGCEGSSFSETSSSISSAALKWLSTRSSDFEAGSPPANIDSIDASVRMRVMHRIDKTTSTKVTRIVRRG